MEVTYIIKYNLCFEDDTKLVQPLLHMQKLPLQDNTKLKPMLLLILLQQTATYAMVRYNVLGRVSNFVKNEPIKSYGIIKQLSNLY